MTNSKTKVMGALEQRELIAELRHMFKDSYIHEMEDHVFWAFLTIGNGNINKAQYTLTKYMEAQFILTNVNTISYKNYTSLKEVSENFKHEILGFDQNGCPVVWCLLGCFNAKELIVKGFRRELFMSVFKLVADVSRQMYTQNLLGFSEPGAVLIIDLKGISFKKFIHFDTLRLLLGMVKDLEPLLCLVKKVYILNNSWIFYYLRNLVRPFLSKSSTERLEILNSDENKWKERLRQNFPINILPFEYGGTGTKVLS